MISHDYQKLHFYILTEQVYQCELSIKIIKLLLVNLDILRNLLINSFGFPSIYFCEQIVARRNS